MIRELWADLRFAVRALAKHPLPTGIAVVTLALGIGSGTAVFSVVNGVLLQPLSYPRSDRLVAVFEDAHAVQGSRTAATSPATFLDWSAGSHTLEGWTAAHPWSPSLTGRDRPDQLSGLKASPNLFELLEARPMLGRTFGASDGGPGHDAVVVLSYELWRARLGADRAIIGKPLVLDGKPFEVVGVMPPGFRFPPFWATDARFWAPLTFDAEAASQRRSRFLRTFARLAPGATLREARGEMELIGKRLEAAHPDALEDVGVTVEPIHEPVVAPVRPALLTLLAAAALLGLVACANVTLVLLARALDRAREVAVRMALGAPASRIVRLTLLESLTLAAAGGAAGLLLGHMALAGLLALAPSDLPRLSEISLDRSAVAFAVAVALAAGLATGVLPALRAARGDPALHLGAGARGASPRGRTRTSSSLVAAQVAVALALTFAAAALIQSFLRQSQRDVGVDAAGAVTMQVSLGGSPFGAVDRMPGFVREAERRVAASPGVAAAGFLIFPHIGGDLWQFPYLVEGRPEPPPNAEAGASVKVASPGAIDALGIPLLQGRDFSDLDTPDSSRVILVNRSLAKREWGTVDPVGKRLRVSGEWREVIGVVGDVVQDDLTHEVLPEVYFPYAQNPVSFYKTTTLVVRGRGSNLSEVASRRIWELDPDIPITDVRPMASILARSAARARFTTALVAQFAAASVLLAGVGLFGVVSHGVGRRTRELAIRAALGASPRRLVASVVATGLRAAAVGAVLGAAGALALGRALGSLLFEVSPADPASLIVACVATLGFAAAAAWLAAWRAGRASPAAALQAE
jgi:predicted permease